MMIMRFLIFVVCFFVAVQDLNAFICDEGTSLRERTCEVVNVVPFSYEPGGEDEDRGAYFMLSDGSAWLRTAWHCPRYFLTVGQSVTLILMSDEEIEQHLMMWQRQGIPTLYRPYWLIMHAEEGSVSSAVAYIAFQTGRWVTLSESYD